MFYFHFIIQKEIGLFIKYQFFFVYLLFIETKLLDINCFTGWTTKERNTDISFKYWTMCHWCRFT